MPKLKAINFPYKTCFWVLVAFLTLKSVFIDSLDTPNGAHEVVMKRELAGGCLYATRYAAAATDPDTLRFYISKPLQGDDTEILQQLNKASSFLITDSALKDIVKFAPTGG